MQNEVELMKARVGEKDSAEKRKLVKRRWEPSSTDETNSPISIY